MRSRNRHPAAPCLIVALACTQFWADRSFALETVSIDGAVARALQQNAGVAQNKAAIASKQENLLAAQRWTRPTLSAEISALRGTGKPTSFSAVNSQFDPETPSPREITGYYGVGTVMFNVPIYQDGAFFFQASPGEGKAEGELHKSESEADGQSVELANQVAKAYFSALSALERVALHQEAVEKLQRRLDAVRQRQRAAGLGTREDELSAEASLADTRSNLNAARRQADLQKARLSLALGLGPVAPMDLLPVEADFPPAPALETLNAVIDRHPALRSQAAQTRIARSDLDAQRAEYLPKLTFNVSRTEAGNFHFEQTNKFYSAGVKLSVPLLDFGQSTPKVDAKSFAVKESEQKTAQTRVTLIQSAYEAYYAFLDAVDKVEAGKATLAKVDFQAKLSAARQAKTLAGLDEVLKDETEVLAKRVNQVELRYAAWNTWADLVKAAGLPFTRQFELPAP